MRRAFPMLLLRMQALCCLAMLGVVLGLAARPDWHRSFHALEHAACAGHAGHGHGHGEDSDPDHGHEDCVISKFAAGGVESPVWPALAAPGSRDLPATFFSSAELPHWVLFEAAAPRGPPALA